MNILLTCAGRRNYLVDYFKEALGKSGKVYTVNSTADATSMISADGAFVAPPLYAQEYISFLINICQEYDIKLLVSLFDLELPILAKHKHDFENLGITMAVSDWDVIELCNDKCKIAEFSRDLDLKTLFTTTSKEKAINRLATGNLQFPLYIKPRWGMGSIAMQKADNEEELQVLFHKVRRDIQTSYLKYYDSMIFKESVIIQEKAVGQEYGLDVINDLKGNYITTFVKRKLAMRSGETDIAITEKQPMLEKLGQRVATKLKHVGNLDVDVFLQDQEPVILEMNARFGGGYPFSHLAGANIPSAYIQWAEGKEVSDDCFNIKVGVKGLKELRLLSFDKINLLLRNS